LTLGAVAVSAGVIGRMLKPTGITLLEVATQSGCTTALDGAHDPQVRKRQSMVLAILIAIVTEDVGQFAPAVLHCRPLDDGQNRSDRQ
jgi:hypothetical protein